MDSHFDLAIDYANNGHVDPYEHGRYDISDDLEEIMEPLTALNQPSTPSSRLESLSLIRIDFGAFAKWLYSACR